MKYIAYGSNMMVEAMARRCPDARLLGTGYIAKARLEFYAHATVETTNHSIDRVPVAVWEISEEDEKALDWYEGFPHYYEKRERLVHMHGGGRLRGMMYVMRPARPSPPSDAYYKGICDAYERLGLGSEIENILEPALYRSQQRCKSCGLPG